MKLEKIGRQPRDLPESCKTNLLLLTNQKIPVNGTIVRWDYYRKDPHVSLYFGIWREEANGSYRLIDFNELTPGVIDFQTAEIEEDEQIQTQRGDIIGVFHSKYCITGALAVRTADAAINNNNAEIEMSDTKPHSSYEVVSVDLYEEDLSPGDLIELDKTNHEVLNLEISLQANIKVEGKL